MFFSRQQVLRDELEVVVGILGTLSGVSYEFKTFLNKIFMTFYLVANILLF